MLASARGALLRGRVRGGMVVCAGERGADLLGAGMLQPSRMAGACCQAFLAWRHGRLNRGRVGHGHGRQAVRVLLDVIHSVRPGRSRERTAGRCTRQQV
jgi:hypothetical protein